MKRILILLALACASAMQLRAQFFHNTYKELSSAPRAQLINTEEIQGHDDLDSLCYLRAYTFRMPYSNKSDKNKIDKLIERIQSQFESASKNLNSYCSIAPLNNGCQIKSRRVAHFFKKDEQEFIIGGPGRCYMSMRCQDTGNPSYRTAEGMEWWLYKEGGKEEVRFKVFILHGLMGKSLSNTLSINFASSYTVFDTNIKILQPTGPTCGKRLKSCSLSTSTSTSLTRCNSSSMPRNMSLFSTLSMMCQAIMPALFATSATRSICPFPS